MSVEMKAPTRAFLDWLDSLPVSHRVEVALFVVGFHPYFGPPSNFADPESFVPALRAGIAKHGDDTSQDVGIALTLRSLVDHFLLARGKREEWQSTKNKLGAMKAILEQRGEGSRPDFDTMLQQLPLRREQWIASIDKWKALKSAELSDDYLDSYWAPTITKNS